MHMLGGMTEYMNKSTKFIVVVVPIVAVFAILIGIIAWIQGNSANCNAWFNDLGLKKSQLAARSNSLAGSLDLGGDLEAERIALNAEINDYNRECA